MTMGSSKKYPESKKSTAINMTIRRAKHLITVLIRIRLKIILRVIKALKKLKVILLSLIPHSTKKLQIQRSAKDLKFSKQCQTSMTLVLKAKRKIKRTPMKTSLN